MATTGVPTAAAICIGPESLVIKRSAFFNKADNCKRLVFPERFSGFDCTIDNNSLILTSSSLLPIKKGCAFNLAAIVSISSAYLFKGHIFASHLADGLMAIKGLFLILLIRPAAYPFSFSGILILKSFLFISAPSSFAMRRYLSTACISIGG